MADLQQIELALSMPENLRLHSAMGSIFHGLIMELAGSNTAEWLHGQSHSRPFSQCVYFDRERRQPIWRISTLTEEAGKRLIYPVLENLDRGLTLQHREADIVIDQVLNHEFKDYQELTDESFLAEPGAEQLKSCSLELLTTTSFKRDGRYVIMPDMYLFFQSLISRWNACNEKSSILSQGLEKELGELCYISSYNLRSQSFSVNGAMLYGFGGSMKLRFGGNDMSRRLMSMLLHYGDFAGIGIKTALGMGAVRYLVQ